MSSEISDRTAKILTDAGFGEVAEYRTMDRPDSSMLYYQARQIAYAEEKLEQELAYLTRKLADAQRHLTEGLNLNNLGVVQGSGADVDRAVALRQERWDTFSMLVATVQEARRVEGYRPPVGTKS